MSTYYCVDCEHCRRPLPLIQQRNGPFQYDFPNSFDAMHSDHDPGSGCRLSASYGSEQVGLYDIPAVPGFSPHPAFRERRTL